MMTFARLLMCLGLFAVLIAGLVWVASLLGWVVEIADWAPHAAGGGLVLVVIGCNIFFRRTSGVRQLPPGHSLEKHPRHFR